MSALVARFFAFSLLVSACGSSSDPNACTGSLSDYCDHATCPAYDQLLAPLQDCCKLPSSDPRSCHLLVTGTTGAFRYIDYSSVGLGGVRTYHDGDGKIVGVSVSSDTNAYCDGSSSTRDYGEIPGGPSTTTSTCYRVAD